MVVKSCPLGTDLPEARTADVETQDAGIGSRSGSGSGTSAAPPRETAFGRPNTSCATSVAVFAIMSIRAVEANPVGLARVPAAPQPLDAAEWPVAEAPPPGRRAGARWFRRAPA